MSSGARQQERYRFADVLIDGATRQVMREGHDVALPSLSFDLLLVMARHAPRVLSIDELMEQVWPGRVVNAETVAKRVELVREALGDDSHGPRYIALVRGRGYRLVPEVRAETQDERASATVQGIAAPSTVAEPVPVARRHVALFWATGVTVATAGIAIFLYLEMSPARMEANEAPGQASVAATPSVAVLPFVNLSDDASNVYFSDGISEELVSSLARLPRLRVASRTSSFAYRNSPAPLPEIARALNVDHIVEGSVRKAGNRIRITAQLIDVASDSHLWAQSYDRELEDIFSIQDEISSNVVAALRATLDQDPGTVALRSTPTGDLEAYQLYLRGRHLWNMRGERNLRESIKLLMRAVEVDPDFARGHAALAQALVLTTFYYDEPDDRLPALAARSAERAIELEPTLSAPYAVQGMLAMQRMDWQGAQSAHRHAIELNSNDATAWYWLGESLALAGRTSDALPFMMKALELDPISAPLLLDIGELHLRRGDHETGCQYVERATRVAMTMYAWLALARCHEIRGDMAAVAEADRNAERVGGIETPVLALVRRAIRDPAEKPAAIAALRAVSRGNIVHLPGMYRALGEIDAAFDAIERPLKRHNFNELRDLWVHDASDLRAHPRFRALVERIGLLDYWRKTEWPDVCRPQGDGFVCD